MNPFRPLAPSKQAAGSQQAGSSGQDSLQQITTPSSDQQMDSWSDSGQASNIADESMAHRSRKRRAPAHVSQNACTNCKKARSKCDGVEPDACTRCSDRGVDCQYEVHIKTAKEEMMRRIKDLEEANRSEKEKSAYLTRFFDILMNDQRGPEAMNRLRQGYSLDQVIEFIGDPDLHIHRLSPPSEQRLRGMVRLESSTDTDMTSLTSSTEASSTRRSSDPLPQDMIQHLMALYFTWIHPAHMLFSEKHMVAEYRSGRISSSSTYSTPSIVNLMCSLGCTMFVDRDRRYTQRDIKRWQRQFLDQAQLDLQLENAKKPTFATAYAMLFLAELSMRQARKAISHLRVAVDSLRHLKKGNYDDEAFEIMFWGVHTLTTTWAGFTYIKPFNPVSYKTSVFDGVASDSLDSYWQYYRYPGDNLNPHKSPNERVLSRAIATAKESAKLNQVIHHTLNTYCGSGGRVTGEAIVTLYRNFLDWKSALPAEFLCKKDLPSTPHLFYLHVLYSAALCQLLQPLLDSGLFPPAKCELLQNIILSTAREGLNLIYHFGERYTHRYHTPMQLFCLVHLADSILQEPSSFSVPSAIALVLTALHDAEPGFEFAGPLSSMFIQRVHDRGLQLPNEVLEMLAEVQTCDNEAKLDTCERTVYVQPVDQLLERLDKDIVSQFETEWRKYIEDRGRSNSDPQVDGEGVDAIDGMHVISPPPDGSSERSSARSSRSSPSKGPLDVNFLVNP